MFYPPTSQPPESPPIVCEYGSLELPSLLSELQKMARALLPGGRLRLVSELPDAWVAIPAWCQATGYTLAWQSKRRSWLERTRPFWGSHGCADEYVFDIERSEG